jgi:hypothetical protein
VSIKVDSLLLYPDFEYNFEMFSSLKGMQACASVGVCVTALPLKALAAAHTVNVRQGA